MERLVRRAQELSLLVVQRRNKSIEYYFDLSPGNRAFLCNKFINMRVAAFLSVLLLFNSCGFFGKSEEIKEYLEQEHEIKFNVIVGTSTGTGRYVELEPESDDETIEFREQIFYMLASEFEYFDELKVKQLRVKYPSETRAYNMTEIKCYSNILDQFKNDVEVLRSHDQEKIKGIFGQRILKQIHNLSDSLKAIYSPKVFNLEEVIVEDRMFLMLPNNAEKEVSDTTLNFRIRINDGTILQNALISYSIEEEESKIVAYKFWNIKE